LGKVNAVTVKASSELKEKMKQVKVNWSQYIRDAIQKKIEEQKLKTERQRPVRTSFPNHRFDRSNFFMGH